MVNSFTSMSGDGLSLKTNWKHEGYISYIPIFVACTLLFRVSMLFIFLIPVHCCWFNPALLVSIPYVFPFNLPSLCSCNPHVFLLNYWNSSSSLVSVAFIPIFATEILMFGTKPRRKHCPEWTLTSQWQICMRRPHWHSWLMLRPIQKWEFCHQKWGYLWVQL